MQRSVAFWLCLSLFLSSSPGRQTGTDATCMSWPVAGGASVTTQCSIAPGEHIDDTVHHAVPYLRCSEHASNSTHRSSLAEQKKAPPRCPINQQHVVNHSPRDPMCHDMTGRRQAGESQGLNSLTSCQAGTSLLRPCPTCARVIVLAGKCPT